MEEGGSSTRRNLRKNRLQGLVPRIFFQALTMTFLAEWGDRSQIATVVMATREVRIQIFIIHTLSSFFVLFCSLHFTATFLSFHMNSCIIVIALGSTLIFYRSKCLKGNICITLIAEKHIDNMVMCLVFIYVAKRRSV